jgi:glycosyltransferase involved in cell wall biosynthesis
MPGISVIVCTHNPRPDYLRRVLDALYAQTVPKVEWELLLIDNASDNPLADTWMLSGHPHARHIREDKLGLTPARLRGIRESGGDLLVYVDDDNVLAPDYLQTARTLLMEHPNLGVIGAGILEPEFAVQPPSELVPYLGELSLRHVSESFWSTNTNDLVSVPWGAGLCVRRRVSDSYLQLVNQLDVTEVLDRRGAELFGGGDIAFSWASVAGGQGFGVFPELHITHLISADRLTQRHFFQLAHDKNLCSGVLHYLREGLLPGDGHSRVEQWVRLLLRGIRRGLFPMRLQWAASVGMQGARHFIEQRRLRPLDHANHYSAKLGSARHEISNL